MKLGIVGLPNVGKSTLFNSLTKAGAESANYPFCTIDPNVGVVTVPDHRLDVLGEMYNTKKITPAAIEFVDIAGLVKGASKGEGLGNQFLANIREVDGLGIRGRCGRFDRIIGNIPFNHAGQATAGKTSAESSTAFSATVCTDMGGMTAAASRKVIAGKALKSAESPGRNHSLRQHTASGMADIDAQTCHKRIDLL